MDDIGIGIGIHVLVDWSLRRVRYVRPILFRLHRGPFPNTHPPQTHSSTLTTYRKATNGLWGHLWSHTALGSDLDLDLDLDLLILAAT